MTVRLPGPLDGRAPSSSATPAARLAAAALASLAMWIPACNDAASPPSPVLVTPSIDWPSYLARNDPVWDREATEWRDGAFLGNGLLGAMVYEDAPGVLRFEMGRTDVTARYRVPGVDWSIPRVPIGDLLVSPVGAVAAERMRLHLWDAELAVRVETDRGALDLRAFVHADEALLAIEIAATGDEAEALVSFRPRYGESPRIEWEHATVDPAELPPMPTSTARGEVQVTTQPLMEAGEYATAWHVEALGAGRRVVRLTVASSHPGRTATDDAVAAIERLRGRSLDDLTATHRAFWHAYYPLSMVSVPDPVWESFYWIQMYKHASATRPGGIVIDNQGPWLTASGWPGTWWNLNVELSYSPVYTANRLAQGQSLCEALWEYRDNLAANSPLSDPDVALPAALHLERHSSFDLLAVGHLPIVYELGNLAWALHDCYRLYRHSMDDAMLRDRIYPLLRGAISLYLQIQERGDDGRIHLPATHSPEYEDPSLYPDTNYALATYRWLLETMLATLDRLDLDDPLLPRYEEALADLVDPPADDEQGLYIAAGRPLEHGHRHYSHLLAIHPLHLLDPHDPSERPIIERSFWRWYDLGTAQSQFNGYSYAAAASIRASLGDADGALADLEAARRRFSSNTMYLEGGGPVIETPFATTESLQDLLLTSWGGVIRVFPAVPLAWPDVSVHDLRAEGDFLLSAVRRGGITAFVRVRSLAGEPCRIAVDLPEPIGVLSDRAVPVARRADGTLDLGLRRGEVVVLYSGATPPDLTVAPVDADPARAGPWGLGE